MEDGDGRAGPDEPAGVAEDGVAAAVGTWITTAQAASPEAKLDTAAAEEITRDWPGASKAVAKEMLQKYGAPQEATPTMLIWRSNGPWKRTIVHKEVSSMPSRHPIATFWRKRSNTKCH